jgi:hypothetical protein
MYSAVTAAASAALALGADLLESFDGRKVTVKGHHDCMF